MAVSVSHAMRRHLAGPSEPPYIYPTGGDSSSYTGGGLSQSMRYTETWLYGVPPAQSGLILPYPPAQPLVVLCSCAGTKRSSKKTPSICKKCKGTKLPVASGGTLRGNPQNGTIRSMQQLGGTVRGFSRNLGALKFSLTEDKYNGRGYHTVRESGSGHVFGSVNKPTVKSRPSIFDLEELDNADPYDLMRRSRLVSPAETRPRTKSTSPHRGRRRRRSPSPVRHRSRSANRTAEWIDPDGTTRRSILECDVNPYELMGKAGLRDSVDEYLADMGITTAHSKKDNFYEDVPLRKTRNYEPININKEKKLLRPSKELAKPAKINDVKPLPERPPRKSKSDEPDIACIIKCEPHGGRFKSILKKTSTFSDTDSNSERVPSPVVQITSGSSQFYLPSPTLTQSAASPRKKVQFLVENVELCSRHTEEAAVTVIATDAITEEVERVSDAQQLPLLPGEVYAEEQEVLSVPAADDTHQESITTTNITIQQSIDSVLKDVHTEGPPKLRRSLSDRIANNAGAVRNPLAVQFNDTMALRTRASRTDHREVFTAALQRLDGIPQPRREETPDADGAAVDASQRPREPPPPPPAAPVAPTRKKQDRRKKLSLDSVSSSADSCLSTVSSSESFHSFNSSSGDSFQSDRDSLGSDIKIVETNKQTSSLEEEKNERNTRKISIEIYSDTDLAQSITCTTSSENKPPSVYNGTFNPSFASSPQVEVHNDYEPISRNIIKISNSADPPTSSNVTSVTLNGSIPSPKTVVQISPLTVHRLKIRNEFLDDVNLSPEIENPQRKTSILITGDDCYSTVNVSEDFPVYQSSVVVNDFGDASDSKLYNSSSVYISCESDKYEQVDPVPNTVITVNNGDQLDDQSYENQDLTSSELTQLLRDPVEAVKRNLVPHVCGKTNMTRGTKRNELGTSVVAKLLKDPQLGSLVEGLESEVVARLLQESLLKLKQSRFTTEMAKVDEKDSLSSDGESNGNSLNSGPYEQIDNIDDNDYSSSNRSSLTEDDLASTSTRSKFYQLLADASLDGDEHQYESIRLNQDPIYEEIEMPPPLPLNPPPDTLPEDNLELDKSFTTRSIFEGASKYDILSYLVDARERGIESYAYSFANSGSVVIECENEILTTGDISLKSAVEVERTDSGVGSESSKSSRSRYQPNEGVPENGNPCEDCNLAVDTQITQGGVVYTPLVCRKCAKRRAERKEIITEIVETEEKYARDLQIILEEFYQPMLVAGLLNAEQLAAVFLNAEELLENSQSLGERLRDALEIALEQGDEDLLTVDVGRLFLDASPMLHSFESYCIRQAAAGLLLANLEKEKELLRIFLKVSQMENAVLRRMNLNSFLMVPVQRVTKYPLLLARLNKVTPVHLEEMKELLTEAQRLVEQHLGQMNASAKDVPSRLWRRLSSGRRTASELDSINIKLRKLAVDILEWNHEEARFALEGKLLYTQPIDSAWRRGRTIKLTPICALLVTLGRPGAGYKSPDEETLLAFPRQTGIREAALVLARDKGGRYSLLREPLYLDRCVVATDPAWQSYFEVQELMTKDTFIFKAEDDTRTITWYRHLQYHAQGMGGWRKRRNALANIMITGMSGRT